MDHDAELAQLAGIARRIQGGGTLDRSGDASLDAATYTEDDNPLCNVGESSSPASGPSSSHNDIPLEWILARRRKYPRHGKTKNTTTAAAAFDRRSRFQTQRTMRSIITNKTASRLPYAGGPVFHGTVTISYGDQALDFAKTVYEAASSLNHLVLWTAVSTSHHDSSFGYSIANQFIGEGWRFQSRRGDAPYSTTTTMHLMSTKFAIQEAIKHAEAWPPTDHVSTTIRVFVPSQAALAAIRRFPMSAIKGPVHVMEVRDCLDILDAICSLSKRLAEMGAKLELYGCPLSKVAAYRVALSAAKYARLTPTSRKGGQWMLAMASNQAHPHGKEALAVTRIDGQDDSTTGSTMLEKEEDGADVVKGRTWRQLINCFKAF